MGAKEEVVLIGMSDVGIHNSSGRNILSTAALDYINKNEDPLNRNLKR